MKSERLTHGTATLSAQNMGNEAGQVTGCAAAAIGMLGSYLNSQEVYTPLKDRRMLHLKAIEA